VSIAPRRAAHAHEGDHEPGAAITRSSRPARKIEPHRQTRRPLVALGAGSPVPDALSVGRKAASLWWLASQGVPVPPAVAVPADAAAGLVRGDSVVREMLRASLKRWLDPQAAYAVRSSADVEDGDAHSFAGQFMTLLDVPPDDVLSAIEVVADPRSDRLTAYLERSGVVGAPRLAVIVQRMVPSQAAGVAFSRNPLTGLTETVIEAVPGSGRVLVDEGVTPDRWVRHWGAFTVKPGHARVPEALIHDVAAGVSRLAAAAQRPLDLEWASDGRTLWWLQSRPMTGLEGLRLYSNRIAREVLPGIIKPLVWTVNVPIVNAAWIDLLERMAGPLDIQPEDLARSFGGRAYFDMTTLGDVFEALGMPRDSLELLLGLPKGPEAPTFKPGPGFARHLGRMPGVLRDGLQRGRWVRHEVRELRATYDSLAAQSTDDLTDVRLLERLDTLAVVTRRAAYANIVVPLQMLLYGKALEACVRQAGLDPTAVDPARDRSDRLTWDPAPALDRLAQAAGSLPEDARAALTADAPAALRDDPRLASFGRELDAFLARFGHLSESGNDFSVPPWREDPGHVVAMALARGGSDGTSAGSLDRARAAGGVTVALADVESRTSPLARPLLRLLWRRAGAFRVYREAVSSTYTFGYGLFRGTFLTIGQRFVSRGLLAAPDDVFYLELHEVRSWLTGDTPSTEQAAKVVAVRRAAVEAAEDLVVPDIIYGDAFVPRRREEVVRSTLSGHPTSRGSARGPARIVRGSADFGRVQHGDILVIPFSDVAWTPLFTRAAGVVAEAGGMLSHSSIVAREYGIPCVVSVADATLAIPDGATLIVDGASGTVLVEDTEDTSTARDSAPAAAPTRS
jgi:pyruvate,water dikinase